MRQTGRVETSGDKQEMKCGLSGAVAEASGVEQLACCSLALTLHACSHHASMVSIAGEVGGVKGRFDPWSSATLNDPVAAL